MSPVFDCSDEAGRTEAIARATAAVRAGSLVVFPTDTLYGIGSDAFDHDAVRALLDAKGRGREMPPPVLVADLRTAEALVTRLPAYAAALAEAFWPGPLTLIAQAQPQLLWDLGETNGTVALRVPDHELALALLREVGPMAVSSANRTGYPAARNILDAATQLGAAVETYLDGGPVRTGLPSTIVDCTGDAPVILRLGALSEEEIFAVTNAVAPTPEPEPATEPADEVPPEAAGEDTAHSADDGADAAEDAADVAEAEADRSVRADADLDAAIDSHLDSHVDTQTTEASADEAPDHHTEESRS